MALHGSVKDGCKMIYTEDQARKIKQLRREKALMLTEKMRKLAQAIEDKKLEIELNKIKGE